MAKRRANAYVKNATGKEIESVSVVHKYSDNYSDIKDWETLPNGSTTPNPLRVRYNTGFGTTGQDWWLVTWKYKGSNKVHYTAPNNFRNIIDFLEGTISSALSGGGGGLQQQATALIAKGLFNKESTVGFKKHLLRKSDQAEGVTITISQNSVAFDSESGRSTTEGIQTKSI